MGTNPTLWLCIGGSFLSIEEKTEGLIKNKVEELGYSLYDVYYVKEGKDYFLRVIIDNVEGINLEDCEKVSNAINPILDEADYIKEQYFLEVSSPGIEKVLRKEKHFEEALEKEVEISLFKPLDGQKIFSGILKGFDKENIKIETENMEKQIDRKNIALIKTKYNWDE